MPEYRNGLLERAGKLNHDGDEAFSSRTEGPGRIRKSMSEVACCLRPFFFSSVAASMMIYELINVAMYPRPVAPMIFTSTVPALRLSLENPIHTERVNQDHG
jgi:hypothetical protein